MAVAWQATGTLLGATGTADVTPVIPAHQADDILICITANRVITNTCATPSGWTLLSGPDDETAWRSYVFWKRATSGAETNPLCDWTATSADKYAQVHTFRGAITTGDPFAATAWTDGAADPAVATGVATAAAGQLVATVGLCADNLSTSATVTATDPSSFTVRSHTVIATGADATGFCYTAVRSAAGATGNVSHDFNAAPLHWGILVAAFTEAPPPAGPTVTTFETADWTATTTPKTISVTGGVTGDRIVVCAGGDNGTAGGGNVTACTVSTTSGSTDSWTEPQERLGAVNTGWTNISTTTLTGDGTVTVSIARTQSTGQPWGGFAALCKDAGAIGNSTGLANGATESVSLTTSQDSAVIMLGVEWDHLGIVAFVPSGAIDVERNSGLSNVTWYAGYWLGQASGSRNYGIATSSTANFTMSVVEVLAATAGETGVATADFGFTATAAGVPETFGVAVATFGFTATANGIDRALGQAVASFGFTATASGIAGTPPVTGQATGSFGFTATAAGIPRTSGAAVATFGFTGSAAGIDRALGTALASFGFTATAAGIDRALGAAVASFGFTATTAGIPRVRGAAVATFGFAATAIGFAGTPPVTGTASALFGFTATAQGQPRALGAASAAFGFTATASGRPKVFGLAIVAFGFTGTAVGKRTVRGSSVASFGFTAVIIGLVVPPVTFGTASAATMIVPTGIPGSAGTPVGAPAAGAAPVALGATGTAPTGNAAISTVPTAIGG